MARCSWSRAFPSWSYGGPLYRYQLETRSCRLITNIYRVILSLFSSLDFIHRETYRQRTQSPMNRPLIDNVVVISLTRTIQIVGRHRSCTIWKTPAARSASARSWCFVQGKLLIVMDTLHKMCSFLLKKKKQVWWFVNWALQFGGTLRSSYRFHRGYERVIARLHSRLYLCK